MTDFAIWCDPATAPPTLTAAAIPPPLPGSWDPHGPAAPTRPAASALYLGLLTTDSGTGNPRWISEA